MKIVHIITRLIIGGAQENTLLTCEGLRQRGHDVTLIAGPETGPEGSLWPMAEQGGYECVKLPTLIRAVRPVTDWKCLSDLRGLFRRIGADIVHTHSSKAGILGRKAAWDVSRGSIVHTIHGMSFNRTQPWWTRQTYSVLERWATRKTDAVITVADAMITQSLAARLGPRAKFQTVRSGMRVEHFGPEAAIRARVRRQWGVEGDTIVVGTIARLFRNKGYEWILKSMPEMVRRGPRMRFVWVGDGAQRDSYLAELRHLGLGDRVRLTGLVPPEEIPNLLRGFDLLLHASDWEGLPRAVVQALLTRVPVVCFDNDGAPEVVQSGVTGQLVRFGDWSGLAEGVLRLAADADLRAQMGLRGEALCRVLFDWRRMVQEIEAVYERVCSRHLGHGDPGLMQRTGG